MGTDKGHEEYFNKVYDATFNAVSRYVVSKCGSIEDAKDIISIFKVYPKHCIREGLSYNTGYGYQVFSHQIIDFLEIS